MTSVLLFCILFLFMLSYQFYCYADQTYNQHYTQKKLLTVPYHLRLK